MKKNSIKLELVKIYDRFFKIYLLQLVIISKNFRVFHFFSIFFLQFFQIDFRMDVLITLNFIEIMKSIL